MQVKQFVQLRTRLADVWLLSVTCLPQLNLPFFFAQSHCLGLCHTNYQLGSELQLAEVKIMMKIMILVAVQLWVVILLKTVMIISGDHLMVLPVL